MLLRSALCLGALAVTHCFCYTSPCYVLLLDWVAGIILALMSAYLIVEIERAFRHAVVGLGCNRLKREVAAALRIHGIEEALRVCTHHSNSLLALGLRTALAEIKTARSIADEDLERAREGFSRVWGLELASLKRGTTLLKTIGQTAVLLGFMTAGFDTCTVLEYVPDTEGVYPGAFGYEGASALKFAVAGMLISLVAIWTYRFICFRIESAAAQADRSFLELAALYVEHRTAMEAMERIQRTGLQIWEQ